MHDAIAIPVKRVADAKTRLSGLLNPSERASFAAAMFQDVLSAAKLSAADRVMVVTTDEKVAQIAEDRGSDFIRDTRDWGLNQAVRMAVEHALSQDVDRLLVLHADLPLVHPADLNQLFESKSRVAIAPSRLQDGTNGLLLCPPDIIRTKYGTRSFEKHLSLAHSKGIEPAIVRSQRLALDIDTPHDVRLLCNLSPKGYTRRFLSLFRIGNRVQSFKDEPESHSPLKSRSRMVVRKSAL